MKRFLLAAILATLTLYDSESALAGARDERIGWHANKVAHGDYAWGRDGDGFSERWVLNSLSRRAVYVVEHDCMPVGTFSLDWDDEAYGVLIFTQS
jgi:hypothetical protein